MLLLAVTLSAATPTFASRVDITAEIQQDGAYENQPLQGTLTITHNRDAAIDINSFLLDKDKLTVDFVKDVRIDPNDPTILSIYTFQLPGKPPGLYPLPPISVEVGKKTYSTITSSYTVKPRPEGTPNPAQGGPKAAQPSNAAPAAQPSLRLEAGVDGRSTLYPGQNTRLFYRYYFSGNIGLTTEKLPLLDAEGFVKIGEKEIKDSTQGNLSVSNISQEVQAVKPGKYTFPPSLIEGFAYKNDALGHPVYASEKLSSEAPAIEITVLPFPEKAKPTSFNGAVGKFTFKTELITPPKVEVGDNLSLSLIITGKGNIKTVIAPDLCCQPGFSGFFQLSDLPPKEAVSGNTKTTTVPLRLLTDNIKEVPSVEFSFFDPESSNYVVIRSDPIPIKVKAIPLPKPPASSAPKEQQEESPDVKVVPKALSFPAPIEIESMLPLASTDLYNLRFGTWWALAIIPVGIALIAFQLHLIDYAEWRRRQGVHLSSSDLYVMAFAQKGKCNFELLYRAFNQALAEAGIDPEQGLGSEVKGLIASFEEKRFGGKEPLNIDDIRKRSDALFAKIPKEETHDASA